MELNIVIPTINRKDLLLELLLSLDKQTDQFNKVLVIDNGNQNIEENLTYHEMTKQKKIEIYIPQANLGVSGSWNFGIDAFRSSDYILILNDDIVLGTNQLKRINEFIADKKFWLLVGENHWCVFMLAKECWNYFLQTDGYVFDTKFFPAYFEDNDFHYRLLSANRDMNLRDNVMNPEVFRNSMTIQKDSKLNSGFSKNEQYYIQKWGGRPGHEKFKTPFNK